VYILRYYLAPLILYLYVVLKFIRVKRDRVVTDASVTGSHSDLEMADDVNNDQRAQQDRSVVSRIRNFNHHAFTSVNAFFQSPTPEELTEEDRFDADDDSISNQDIWDPAQEYFGSYQIVDPYSSALTQEPASTEEMKLHETHTPTQSRPATPQNRSFTALRLFQNFSLMNSRVFASNSADVNYEGIPLSDFQSSDSSLCVPEEATASRPRLTAINTNLEFPGRFSDTFVSNDTPPLSPDASSISSSLLTQDTSPNQLEEARGRDRAWSYSPEYTQEIREGKKPERSIVCNLDHDQIRELNMFYSAMIPSSTIWQRPMNQGMTKTPSKTLPSMKKTNGSVYSILWS
jgi:hypothetical protein